MNQAKLSHKCTSHYTLIVKSRKTSPQTHECGKISKYNLNGERDALMYAK